MRDSLLSNLKGLNLSNSVWHDPDWHQKSCLRPSKKKKKVVAYAFGKRFRKVSRKSENSRSTAWKTVPTVEDIQNSWQHTRLFKNVYPKSRPKDAKWSPQNPQHVVTGDIALLSTVDVKVYAFTIREKKGGIRLTLRRKILLSKKIVTG